MTTDMPNLRSVFLEKKNNYFKDFGPATVKSMFSSVSGDELLRLLAADDASALSNIDGINSSRLLRLRHGYAVYRPLLEVASYLDKNGFQKPIATQVFQVWGSQCMEKIHSNPYCLLALAPWPMVDALGLQRGPRFHPCRLVAAIENCMYEDYEENKHTYIGIEDLFIAIRKLIGCNRSQFEHGLDLAVATNAIVTIGENLQVPAVNLFERHIEKFLHKNIRTGISEEKIDNFLNSTEGYSMLTNEQRSAVANALMNRFSLYYGRGGRGKTFTLKAIADGAEKLLKKQIILTAVAAKACRKMENETGRKAFTLAYLIHRMEKKDLLDSLIVIDESSMLSIVDFFQILKKAPATASIVMLGDPNQIPSISAGRLFYDIVQKKVIPSQELTINKRQDKKTDTQLNQVLSGDFPLFDDYSKEAETGLYRIHAKSVEDAERRAVDLYLDLKRDRENVQIISPLANYPGGSKSINSKVHYELFRRQDYVGGTPVVWTQNMAVEWGIRLTNGSMGYVKGKGTAGTYLEVAFELEGDVHLTWEEANNHLEKAYCLTVHKAQGSDWDNVIIVLPPSTKMVDRNMVYTALSRCKRRAIVIYNDHSFVSRQVSDPPAHESRRSLLFSGVQ